MLGSCFFFLLVQGREKRLYGMEGNGLGEELCLPETDIEPEKGIFLQKIHVFHIVEEGF